MEIILTDENFEKETQAAEKFVLVDFFAEWCGPCQALAPILERVAKELKDKIILAKVNVDEAPLSAGKFNVDRIPAVVLLDKGKLVSGFVGLLPEAAVKEWLKGFLDEKQTGGDSKKIEELIKASEKYAKENGFKLNPDKEAVLRVVKGLLLNERKHGKIYCPCRRVTGDLEKDKKIICPCDYHKQEIAKDGRCFCGLFVKE